VQSLDSRALIETGIAMEVHVPDSTLRVATGEVLGDDVDSGACPVTMHWSFATFGHVIPPSVTVLFGNAMLIYDPSSY
jgi:hypothetical protein